MKTKDEVFNKFQKFKALMENQIGKKIKVLMFENVGEYTSKNFHAFCKKARIKRELTLPYNCNKMGLWSGRIGPLERQARL